MHRPGNEDREKAMAGIRLDGKVAIVTGGGQGLGRAMALVLAEAGARDDRPAIATSAHFGADRSGQA
jgi:NAD(P)-dependent dehydrogenase (short-subunit alcohol dehydrogenase family)